MSITQIVSNVPENRPEVLVQFLHDLGKYFYYFSPQNTFASVAEEIRNQVSNEEEEEEHYSYQNGNIQGRRVAPLSTDFTLDLPISEMVTAHLKVEFSGNQQSRMYGNNSVHFNPDDVQVVLEGVSLQFLGEDEVFKLGGLRINLTPSRNGFSTALPSQRLEENVNLQNAGYLSVDQIEELDGMYRELGVSSDDDHSLLIEMLIEYTTLGEIL